MTFRRAAIGVFDSGFGGLTVLKALLELVPDADYLYFGDTARLPYGSKSVETVARYAVEAANFLEQRGAQLLVIACNTATALALDSESEIEQQACKFEHILSPEATDKICTFLGHPRTCPHGAPIPPGPCCGRTAEFAQVSASNTDRVG